MWDTNVPRPAVTPAPGASNFAILPRLLRQEAVHAGVRVLVQAGDVLLGVDVHAAARRRIRDVEQRHRSVGRSHEAVLHAGDDGVPRRLAARIDPRGARCRSVVECEAAVRLAHEAVVHAAAVDIGADDVALGVDPHRHRAWFAPTPAPGTSNSTILGLARARRADACRSEHERERPVARNHHNLPFSISPGRVSPPARGDSFMPAAPGKATIACHGPRKSQNAQALRPLRVFRRVFPTHLPFRVDRRRRTGEVA